MTIQILEYTPVSMDTVSKNPNFQKLGHVRVKGNHLDLWLEVVKNQNSAVFFRIPQIKVGDKWKKAYEIVGQPEFEKYIKEQIGAEFQAKYC